MADKQGSALSDLLGEAAKNSILRQMLILVGIAASVALGLAAAMWSQGPDYKTLYASLSPERASSVVDSLGAAGIPYKIQSTTGAIMVPAKSLHNARLKLAGQGVMRDSTGMAMLDEQQGFGVSEFMQSKKYQYALEQELAKTIQSMQQVRRARVHLAVPKQSVFIRDRKPPSASIMLDIHAGSSIAEGNVKAIVSLVAASISGMNPDDVTVVDQDGQQLSQKSNDDNMAMNGRQFAYRQRIEESYEDRIADLIRPIAGSGQVRVKVAANIDFSTMQESRESWNPEKQVIRSEKISEQNRLGAASGPEGIPGALSNQPPGVAEAASNENTTDTRESRSITRNYEIERVLNHTTTSSGGVTKLSVAVVVDNRRSQTEEGESVSEDLSREELDKLTLLVKDAIGFDAERGDRVTVVSADFRQRESAFSEEMVEPGFWEAPWFANLLRQGLIGMAVLFIVFAILRPGMRTLLNANSAAAMQTRLPAATPGGYVGGELQAQPVAALGGPVAGLGFDQKMTDVRNAVDEDPRRVAQVVNKWVSDNDES